MGLELLNSDQSVNHSQSLEDIHDPLRNDSNFNQYQDSNAEYHAKESPKSRFISTMVKFNHGGLVSLCERDNVQRSTQGPEIKVYSRRFWMLFVFVLCTMANCMPWLQYTTIANISMCYYNVSVEAVNMTSLLYLITYIPTVLPMTIFLDRFGLRATLLAGMILTLISAGFQCISLERNSFSVILLSQTLVGIGEVFILPLPPRLASVWFGADEVSRATAVGVFGNQFGTCLSFIFTSMVVPNDCEEPLHIRRGFAIVAYTLVALNVVILLIVLFTFQKEPPLPPSVSEAHKSAIVFSYKRTLLNLVKNLHFDMLLAGYGLIIGVYFAFSTILNELLIPFFPQQEKAIGWIGLAFVAAGQIGSVVAGYVLDYTHKFKLTSMVIFVCSVVMMAVFTAVIYINILWLQFVIISIMGFFLTSYLPIGFEFATEVTYPEPEGTTASLMNASTMFLGIWITLSSSRLLEVYGPLPANLWLCALIVMGCIITAFVKSDLRRTSKNAKPQERELQTPGQ